MKDVKDNGIGVGLSCSKIISEFLGGSVKILNSINTSIKISIPIQINENSLCNDSEIQCGQISSMISDDIGSFKWNNKLTSNFLNMSENQTGKISNSVS
jgi:hypothetical protein